MANLAADLVDDVLGGLPVRQWVLTTPHRLRCALAYDQRLSRRVLAVFIRAVLSFERRRARRRGVVDGRGGAVTAIQRFASPANLSVHFQSLVVQGVLAGDGARFVRLPAPSNQDVWRVLATVRRRVVRLAWRHRIDLEGDGIVDGDRHDELAEKSPLLRGLAAASVAGCSAIGAGAGSRAVRLGRTPEAAPDDGSGAACHAHIAGFDLHAGVAVPAGDRTRLEHLCRYVLRPPIAQDSLSLAPDGRVCLALRRPWRDGTRTLLFDPLDFLGRLAALTPKPRVNLLLYHGVFASHAARRRAAVPRASEAAEGPAESASPAGSSAGLSSPRVTSGSATVPSAAGTALPAKRAHGSERRVREDAAEVEQDRLDGWHGVASSRFRRPCSSAVLAGSPGETAAFLGAGSANILVCVTSLAMPRCAVHCTGGGVDEALECHRRKHHRDHDRRLSRRGQRCRRRRARGRDLALGKRRGRLREW